MSIEPQEPISLDQLHTIVLPPDISWWPIAPGWYVLALLLLWVFLWFGFFRLKQHRSLAYRREALGELAALQLILSDANTVSGADSETDAKAEQAVEVIRSATTLLKRTAIHVYSRERVASLTGEEWVEFLESNGPPELFNRFDSDILIDGANGYLRSSPQILDQATSVLTAIKVWVRSQGAPHTILGDGSR
jgi:Domain of unknown function (DUF4381)